MTWSERRKLAYGGTVIGLVGLVGVFLVYQTTKVTATCFDGKKNGSEVGVDCGGSCLQYCPNELTDPKVRWKRSFEVTPGVVHAVAYIEHSYPGAAARRVGYKFRLYDAKNSLITERTGTTMIGPIGRTAIVEPLIQTGNIPVAFTNFSFDDPIVWEKIDPTFSSIVIKTDRTVLENTALGTRLTATLENKSRYQFKALDVVALLYDQNDNTITASKTVVPSLAPLSNEIVYFTWPQKIDKATVKRIEITPRINPFTSTSL